MQVGQLGEQTTPDATAGTPGPSSTAPAIKVSVPREKRFGKYGGARDDRVLEDWISDAQRAVRSQMVRHPDLPTGRCGKGRGEAPSGVFKILREVFCEHVTDTQARRKFFARRQGDRESVQDFAHAFMVLLSRPGGAPWRSTSNQQGHTVKRAICREPEGSHPACAVTSTVGQGTTPLPLGTLRYPDFRARVRLAPF